MFLHVDYNSSQKIAQFNKKVVPHLGVAQLFSKSDGFIGQIFPLK